MGNRIHHAKEIGYKVYLEGNGRVGVKERDREAERERGRGKRRENRGPR